jgi:hypothetical protein
MHSSVSEGTLDAGDNVAHRIFSEERQPTSSRPTERGGYIFAGLENQLVNQ